MSAIVSTTNIDGVITPTDEARVPVMDRGFLYGDSVYEVFRTYDGVPLFYAEHWQRLLASAALIYMDIPLSAEAFAGEIRRTVAASGAPAAGEDVYVRYTVTRGEGPMDLHPARELANRYLVMVKAVPAWNPLHYSEGMGLAIPPTRRNPPLALSPNIKGGNYLNNVMGVIEARRLGADDCLMLNEQGLVTEASNSNVFFVINGELVTPSQEAANLKGLTKQIVHQVCSDGGIVSRERTLTVDDIRGAGECFVTSATREVMPVKRLTLEDGGVLEFPPGGGALTRRVAALYKDFVGAYVARHAQERLF
ncbi:MAG: branched-chain amino acid aminotransferase [Gammaproteobacteria bacterium]|nr:branched-chain amino acid aminotransferase [Gammaproteobacteria bacterium]